MRMIKRITKPILALVIVVLLAGIFGGGSLMAAPPDLPTSDQQGDLTIHKFRVEDYENLKESTGSISDAANLPGDARAIAGITFTMEKLVVAAGADPSLTDPIDTAFTAISKVTDDSGVIRFTDLEKGFYLVTETIPEGYTAQSETFIVKVPMDETDSQGNTNWNYDVHVYPKNSGGIADEEAVEKEIENDRLVVGVDDLVPWVVDYPMGSDLKIVVSDGSGGTITKYAYDFYIYDNMDSRQKYEAVEFELLDEDKNVISSLSLIDGTDYTEDAESQEDTVFWHFTDAGTRKLADNNVKYIRAHITTRIKPEAVGSSAEALWNNAWIEYTNGSGDPYKHTVFDPETEDYDSDNVPKVYLGRIRIDKIETNQTETKLAGATFKLAASEEDAKAGNFISRSNANGEPEEIAVTTDASGAAEIDAIGTGTYYLVETQAPEGYELNAAPIEVTVKNDTEERFTNLQISNDREDDTSGSGAGKVSSGNGSSSTAKSVKTGDAVRYGAFLLMMAGAVGIIIKNSKRLKN